MNKIYIKIEGLNLFRIAQKLINGGVMIFDLKIKNTYMIFCVNQQHLDKLKQICKLEHKHYYIIKNTALKRFFAKIPYYFGTFFAILLLFCVFYGIYNI